MRIIIKLIAVFILSSGLSGCVSNGYIYTLYTDQFVKQKKSAKKVILINPEFKAFNNIEENEQNFALSSKMRGPFLSVVNRFCKDSGLNYEIITNDKKGKVETDFFSDLLPLRQVVLQAINNQDNPLNEVYEARYKRVAKQIFIVNTYIPAEMAVLEKKYGTPYFGILEIYSGQDHSYLIHIIADVRNGIVTYQEIKKINGPVKKQLLMPLIYDSFNSLKRI
jgi:hypothetical protein